MKIYALVYQYIKEDEDGSRHTITRLTHCIAESLEDVMEPVEKSIKETEGYIQNSMKLSIKHIMPLDEVLDDIKVKLPELVKNAKEREKLTKVAEALNDYDNKE